MLSKFLNTKTLLLLLVIFGGIYLVVEFTKKEDRTFQSQIIEVDTAKITKIQIIPKIDGGDEITLTRAGNDWNLESGGRFYKPDESSIQSILNELVHLRTERVAATDASKWAKFEVTDSTATRLKVFDGERQMADLYLGKFSYSQSPQQNPAQRQQPRMFTHIRANDDEKVYVVEGMIKMTIQPNLNTYRAKDLISVDPADITKLSFNYPGMNFTVANENNQWMINGTPADSAKTVRYLNKFRRLTSNNFIDDVQGNSGAQPYVLTVEGNNFMAVELKAIPADSVNQFVVSSSLLPDTKFSGGKNKLFERVFVQPQEFIEE